MEKVDVLQLFGSQLLVALPLLIGWAIAVVVAVLLMTRGGGTPATLLLIGSALMLLASLLQVPLAALPPLLVSSGWPVARTAALVSTAGLILQFVRFGGIVCLVLAFWKQFHLSRTFQQTS